MENRKKVSTDRRLYKTKKAIETALFHLLETKPLAEITIKELTIAADINRKTFYNHYTCIEDVIYEIVDRIFEQVKRILEENKTNGLRSPLYIDEITDVLYSQKVSIQLILKGNMQMSLFARTTNLITDWFTGQLEHSPGEITKLAPYKYIMESTVLNIYQTWLSIEPMSLSPQEISLFIKNFLTSSQAFILDKK